MGTMSPSWEREKSLPSLGAWEGWGCRKLPASCESCLDCKLPARLCCPKQGRRVGSGCHPAAPSDTRCSRPHLLSPTQTYRPLTQSQTLLSRALASTPVGSAVPQRSAAKACFCFWPHLPWSPESHFPLWTRSCSCNHMLGSYAPNHPNGTSEMQIKVRL